MSYSYLKNVFPNFEGGSIKTQDLKNSQSEEKQEFVLPQTSLLENFNTMDTKTEINYAPLTHNKNSDNLKFYNIPYNQHSTSNIEGFEEKNNKTPTCDLDCDLYIKHVNECSKCRSIILKQFGIETDRIKNEEIMEVISYLIFGLFILLLIDSLKNSKN